MQVPYMYIYPEFLYFFSHCIWYIYDKTADQLFSLLHTTPERVKTIEFLALPASRHMAGKTLRMVHSGIIDKRSEEE